MTVGICRRGEIYYIKRGWSVGSEQQAGRPAIIVSNDLNNKHSPTVEVVYLTSQPMTNLPTHVAVFGTGRESTALCEQIDSVSVERIDNYCGKCSVEETEAIDDALVVSLGIGNLIHEEPVPLQFEDTAKPEPVPASEDTRMELAVANAKLAMLQKMYDELLERVTQK